MSERERWRAANRALVAKAIGELTYEELLDPEPVGEERYRLGLASGVGYRFRARRGPWTWLRVEPASVTREGEPATDACAFLLDAQTELGIDDLALGELLREVTNTLHSEQRRRRRLAGTDAASLVERLGPRQATYFDGHPKFLANKGRVGWGEAALERYAPEAGNAFRLRFLAVHREGCRRRLADDVDEGDLGAACLDEAALAELRDRLAASEAEPASYHAFPVHPWQYRRFVQTQYAGLLARGDLVDLGVLGDAYLPQLSIRTLANVDRPGRADVKLPLTILNTSCYRGLPGDHLATGVRLSRWLAERAAEDPVLASREVRVLRQLGALHVPHPHQAELAEGPYRFQEMLGAVWRESPRDELEASEQAVPLAALMQTDADGRSLLAEHVERSELSARAWLGSLFDTVTVPLYHLLARYGIGLVAHGQNVGLVLREHRPARAVLKDVHGDLRLVDEELAEIQALPEGVGEVVKRLAPEHLRQDLVTGHLVTTLRFVAPLAAEQLDVPEPRFYELLAETLRTYEKRHPELDDRFATFDLFQDPIDKVLVNRVRLRSGFGQDAQRPEPTFGTPIPNPLAGGQR